MFPTVFNPSAQDIIDFTRQLAALLSSGIPLVRCLTAQRGQVSNKGLKHALGEIIGSVEAGNKLSDALGEQSHIFPDFYVRMLRGRRGYRRASLRAQPGGRDPPASKGRYRPRPRRGSVPRLHPARGGRGRDRARDVLPSLTFRSPFRGGQRPADLHTRTHRRVGLLWRVRRLDPDRLGRPRRADICGVANGDRPGGDRYRAASRSGHRQGDRSQQHVLAHLDTLNAAQVGHVPGRGSQADAAGNGERLLPQEAGQSHRPRNEGTKLGEAFEKRAVFRPSSRRPSLRERHGEAWTTPCPGSRNTTRT